LLLNPDVYAKKLADRFDGLPLALATAGDYISQRADSFGEYLQMYEQSWTDLAENSDKLMEYDDRTLYSKDHKAINGQAVSIREECQQEESDQNGKGRKHEAIHQARIAVKVT